MPAAAPRVLPALALAALLTAAPAAARAADPKPADTALGKVPADAEFYRAALRLGETVETIGRSRAWKALWGDSAVQDLVKKARASYEADEGAAPLRKFFADPANAELPALAADALSNEVFLYMGAGTGDLIALIQEAAGGARHGPGLDQLFGQKWGDDPGRAQARGALRALAEKPERLRVPALVIGFKVSDPPKVAAQLKRVDPLLAEVLKGTPLAGRSGRAKVGGDDFLVLTLDGSLVPWDGLNLAQYEEKKGEFDPLLKHLKSMKLTVAVGVRQGYLLVAVGDSTDTIARFGGDGPKLADRPELKPLAKLAGKPLTAVGYTSAKLRQSVAITAEDVAGYADRAKILLGQADLPADQRKAIEKDLDAFAAAVGRGLTKPGAAASASVRTARGWETLDYDYTDPGPGEPRPLTLLNHLGGDPLLAAVWRSGTTVEDYRALVKWVTVFAGHAERAVVAKGLADEETVKKYRADFVPLLKELSDVTENLWLPALADGQEGFVIDAKWTSKKWHEAMPEADRPLPLPEFGVVLGVSDPDKFGQALEGYRTVANKLIAKVRELAGGTIPEFEIPRPKVERAGGRTFAYYPIPAEWGIDRQFQPTGGLSERVAVLTLSRGHAERLLAETPPKIGLAPFADTKRPLESVFYLNWAGMVDAAGPWVDYAMAQTGGDEDRRRIARKVTGVLKVFRAYGSVTYREGGATVTHSEAVFADLDPEPQK